MTLRMPSSCLECHLAPLSLTSLRTPRYRTSNTRPSPERRGQGRGGCDWKTATAWDGEEHDVFFVNKSYHQQRKGGSMVVWSNSKTHASLLKAAHVPDHLRTECFPARLVGSTCLFFGHSRISTEQLISRADTFLKIRSP